MDTETHDDKVDLLTREIELTKLLASNDPKIRSDGIKQIKQLLLNHSDDTSNAFQLNDYMIIWKGLFYFMWMSDKPLPQESATEKISNLFHCCTSYEGKILFLEAFFLTIKDDWMSISQHRIDKFMMLVRRCVRQVLFTFVNSDWDLQYMEKFSEVLYRALKSFTLSLRSHLQEIFLEELAKVSKGKIPSEALLVILDAFLHYISELNDFMLIKEVTQNVFRNLLSQSPDLEILEAKFQAWHKMGKPGNSYNDLELVKGDIDNDLNEQLSGPMDPRAGNINVEIPRIKFNPKDVAKILNKYVTEVDCTRKCLVEITKLIKWYNRLGDGILPYKPKDLKLKSRVLKRKKKSNLSKMVKEGVKKLEMVDSKIKKSSREVTDRKSLKELDKMGEIIVEHGKIGKSIWKVRKFDECSAFKENFNLNGSWTVSEDNVIEDTNKTVCVADDEEPPMLLPAGFSVEMSGVGDKSLIKTPIQVQKNDLISSGSSNKNTSKTKKVSLSKDLKSDENCKTPDTPSKTYALMKTLTSSGSGAKRSPKVMNNSQSKSPKINDKSHSPKGQQSLCDDLVVKKVKRNLYEAQSNTSPNTSWTVNNDQKLNSNKRKSLQSNFTPVKKIEGDNCSPNIANKSPIALNTSNNDSWSKSANGDDLGSASKKLKKRDLSNIIEINTTTPDNIAKNARMSKSPKSPKSPTPEKRVLRRRTIIIPKNKSEAQNESTPKGTPKRKEKVNSETNLKKRRKTIAGEEISVLKLEEISNKALEKVRSEAFEDGLGTPRKSSRLSFKTDSAKKRVEFQLTNNIAQEFMEYETTLVTNPENPHDASKQPIHGVLKSTPDTIRVNPFYKFQDRSGKKKSRQSII